MVDFIDQYRDLYGVESICELLPIAPSTYFRHKQLAKSPEKRSERSKKDEKLALDIHRI